MATPTYELIGSSILASEVATVTFSSIPSTYRDLVAIAVCSPTVNSGDFAIKFNSDTGSNYNWVFMNGYSSSSTSSGKQTSVSRLKLQGQVDPQADDVNFVKIDILDYAQTNKQKSLLSRFNSTDGSAVVATVGRWASTSAINSLTFYFQDADDFNIGGTFYLYGIAG